MELCSRKDVPVEETWDLSLIFENEQQMWDALEETKAAVKKVVDTYAGKLNTAENIVNCLDEMEQIRIASSKIWSYTGLAVETDYTDNKLRELDEKVGDEMIRLERDTSFVDSEILLAPDDVLQAAVSAIVDETFNMISVDGDTSTNDTLLVLANGEAQNAVISAAEGPAYEALYEALYIICRELAMQMAGDGEGATKLIEVNVQGMDTIANARTLAKSVICSSLTKAAVYGSDANWGRILCALGYAGVEFDPGDLQLYFVDGDTKMLIFTEGAAADYSEEEATELLKKEKVTILAQFHMGDASATAWGCDLTYDYVKINADYRS